MLTSAIAAHSRRDGASRHHTRSPSPSGSRRFSALIGLGGFSQYNSSSSSGSGSGSSSNANAPSTSRAARRSSLPPMSRPATARQQAMPTPPGSPPVRPPLLAPTSPPIPSPTSPRAGFLGSFMRGRTRALSNTSPAAMVRQRVGSPTAEAPNPLNGNVDAQSVTRSVSSPNTAAPPVTMPPIPASLQRTHKIRLVPVLETHRSFTFAPVLRELGVMQVPPGVLPSIAAAAVTEPGPLVNGKRPPLLIRIGRFTDKVAGAAVVGAADLVPGSSTGESQTATTAAASAAGGGGGDSLSPRAAFKSKVVSRSHAEIWCEPGGKFYIRDTASSSGTFLNHIRLSSPNVQSRPQLLKDGDVLQLGVDYQGGAEEMYRCVKMRVEVGREWQTGANTFNTNALQQLKALGGGNTDTKASASSPSTSGRKKASVTDCCICLFSVGVCQSLFIAPCSHVFHYKCIRPLLNQHHPGFSCPLCRTFANLDEDVETDDAWEIASRASRRQSIISRRNSNHSLQASSAAASVAAPDITPVSADQAPEIDGDDLDEILADDDDLLVPPCPDLQRQTTAVGTPPPTNVAGLLVDLSLESPSSVSPAVEQPIPVSPTSVPAEAADAPHVTTPPMPITERTSTPSGRSDTIASLAQTPMNEVFLSSLVINANTPRSSLPPSVHASAPTSVPASAPTSTPASGPSSRPVSGTAARPGVSPRSELDAMFVQDAAVAAAVVDDEHILDEVNNP